jgi:predicted Zn-dependent peptidase
VPRVDRDAIAGRHASVMRPDAATLIVAGDIDGLDITGEAIAAFGGWSAPSSGLAAGGPSAARPGRRIVVVDRPGSPQTELRVGHLGVPRSTPDFHALSVLNAIVGGLFNSRLNNLLREARGYTYGINSSFDMRRHAGPFTVRCAVQTEVTVPAIVDILGELTRIREGEVEAAELTIARDYLVGVFPLRFESAAQVASSITGLVVNGLPDDELDRYRPAIAAVTAEQILAAARTHIRPDEASIVLVGDAARFGDALRDAGLGEVEIIRDEPSAGEGDGA